MLRLQFRAKIFLVQSPLGCSQPDVPPSKFGPGCLRPRAVLTCQGCSQNSDSIFRTPAIAAISSVAPALPCTTAPDFRCSPERAVRDESCHASAASVLFPTFRVHRFRCPRSPQNFDSSFGGPASELLHVQEIVVFPPQVCMPDPFKMLLEYVPGDLGQAQCVFVSIFGVPESTRSPGVPFQMLHSILPLRDLFFRVPRARLMCSCRCFCRPAMFFRFFHGAHFSI